MGIKPIQEPRRGQRVRLAFHVEVSGIGFDGIPYCDHAAASDVSDRGCQIHLAWEVKMGDLLTVRVVKRTAEHDPNGCFLYQTVWVKPIENGGGWIAGLSALDPGNPWCINFSQELLAHQ